MRLPFEQKLNNKRFKKMANWLLYSIIALIITMYVLYFQNREANKKLLGQFKGCTNLETAVNDLIDSDISLDEAVKFEGESKVGLFAEWLEFAAWLEKQRIEAFKREINFRYTLNDNPKVQGQLLELTLTLSLSSNKEGYARFISFSSQLLADKEHHLVLNKVQVSKGENLGIKECIFEIICWIDK